MRTRAIPGQGGRPHDEGFTLIELLVVIIIIGILAAIAIPVFFSQREKAFDAAMKSDIHTLAEFEEAYLVDHDAYGTVAELGLTFDPRASKDVVVSLWVDGSVGYCLEGTHPASTTAWYYDSQAGGLQAKGSPSCPTTVGVFAGQVTVVP